MNEVKFKANKKDLETVGEQIQEATAALNTTGATAGQVLKVETPGEAPVWGEGGPSLHTSNISITLTTAQVHQLVRGEAQTVYSHSQLNAKADRAFFASSQNTPMPVKVVKGTSGGVSVDKHIVFYKYMLYNPNQPTICTVGIQAALLHESEIDPDWTMSNTANLPSEKIYFAWFT